MGKLTVGANNVSLADLGVGTYIVPYNNISLRFDIFDNTYPVDPASPKASMYRNRDLFWCSIEADTNRGTADMTYPFSMTGTAPPPGLGVQFKSTSYTYMTFVATPAYGETFFGWYSQEAGGTLISSSATYSPTLASGFYSAWSKMWGRFTTSVGIYTDIALNTTQRSSSSIACSNNIAPNTSACWNGVGKIPDTSAIIYLTSVNNGVPTSTATKFNGNSQWFSLYQSTPETVIQISSTGVVLAKSVC